MVSFFGIRLGGDKKKSRSKSQDKQQPQKWDRADQDSPGDDLFFDRGLPPPQFPSAAPRPGSSQSTTQAPSDWRSVFGSHEKTMSMSDLAPPAMGAMRHHASESNLRTNFAGGSTTSLAAPAPLGGTGPRPGTPSRPAAMRNAEWVNPLDVHFCKCPSAVRPGTPAGMSVAPAAGTAPRSALGQYEHRPTMASAEHVPAPCGAPQEKPTPRSPAAPAGYPNGCSNAYPNGYPSPPQSDGNSERALSPSSPPEFVTDSHPTSNYSADFHLAAAPDSPTAAERRKHGDKPDGPIIRDVPARRDTLTLHQPRRQSFTTEFDSEFQKVARQIQHVEGFCGNFSAFDFGDGVRRLGVADMEPSAAEEQQLSLDRSRTWDMDASPPTEPSMPRAERQSQNIDDGIYAPRAVPDVPARHQGRGPPPPTGGAMEACRGEVDERGAHGEHRLGASPPRGFNSRFDSSSQTRAPPPRPLFAPQSLIPGGGMMASPRSPYGPPPDENKYVACEAAEAPRWTPSHPPTSPFVRSPMAGEFPKSKGLPRGRQPEKPREPIDDDDEDETEVVYVPQWAEFDAAEPRRSAMPAPLSTPRSDPSRSPVPPWAPSPTLPSLVKSAPGSSDNLTAWDGSGNAPRGSPALGGHVDSPERRAGTRTGGVSPRRVEAVRAPPRRAGMTLSPPLSGGGTLSSASRSPTMPQFDGGFI